MTHHNLIRQCHMDAVLLEGGVSANPRGCSFIAPIGKNSALVDIIPLSIVNCFTAFSFYFTAAVYVMILRFCLLKIFKSKEWLFDFISIFNTKGVNFKVLQPCCVGKVIVSKSFNFFAERLLSKVIKRFLSFSFISSFKFFTPFNVIFFNFRCYPLFVVFNK